MKKRLFYILAIVIMMGCFAPAAKVEAKALKLSKKTITITKGKSKTIKIYNKSKKKKVTWTSSKKSIAKVKTVKGTHYAKAKITAVKRGTCYVYAKVKGKKKLRCKVKVIQPKLNKTTVTVSVGSTIKISFQDGPPSMYYTCGQCPYQPGFFILNKLVPGTNKLTKHIKSLFR